MTKRLTKLIILTASMALVPVTAFAVNGDTTVSVQGPVADTVSNNAPIEQTATAVNSAQDSVGSAIESTGAPVQQSYITIEIGNTNVKVDPIEVDN